MKLKYRILTLGVFIMISFQVQALNKREAFKEARKTCMEELGITPREKGERPSKEIREKIKSCLQAKGISKPAHHRRHKKMKLKEEQSQN